MNSSRLNQILPFKSSALWKGVVLGAVACVLLLVAVVTPNLMMARRAYHMNGFSNETRVSGLVGGAGSEQALADVVHADAPKVIRKADLAMQVANCSETQKKIEALAAAEAGFLESSTLQENSAEIHLRVPSTRFDAVRDKLRGMAIRVTQDSVSAADVSKQYIDREARLRNLRAQEQQFLAIMKQAHTVADVLAVTKELSQVRGEIERADAEFRNLQGQIDMSQISVRLTSEASGTVHWAPGSSVRSAFNDLLQSLASFGDFLIWLIVNLPVLALWIVTAFLLAAASWYVLRRAARILRALFGRKSTAPEPPAQKL